MDPERSEPSGMPEDAPEAPPLGVPSEEDDPEVGELPGIPQEGEPPTSG